MYLCKTRQDSISAYFDGGPKFLLTHRYRFRFFKLMALSMCLVTSILKIHILNIHFNQVVNIIKNHIINAFFKTYTCRCSHQNVCICPYLVTNAINCAVVCLLVCLKQTYI